MIDILGWAPDRQTLITALTTTAFPNDPAIPEKWRGEWVEVVDVETGETTREFHTKYLAALDGDKLVPLPGVNISEIGPITKVPGVYDEDGNELSPPTIIPGHHVNFRIGPEMADFLRSGLPQYDADGNLLTVWERTHLLDLIPELTETTLTEIGEDGQTGYVGLSGLKLYDPRVVTRQSRRWL